MQDAVCLSWLDSHTRVSAVLALAPCGIPAPGYLSDLCGRMLNPVLKPFCASQFLGASQTDEQTLMILEYMENGDLFSAMRKDPAGELLWYRRQALAPPQCISTFSRVVNACLRASSR